MKKEQDYIQDITEIRSMMDRSTRFLSLTGWSGIMSGLYALIGSYLAYEYFYQGFYLNFQTIESHATPDNIFILVLIALAVLFFTIATAIFLSWKKTEKRGEKLWNSAARRLLINMSIPLATGAVLILIFSEKGLFGLLAPLTLIFYGLALVNASKFTYEELKGLGIIEVILGLVAIYFIEYGLILWAVGFGVMHIIYGIYMHLKFEK